MIKFFLKFIIFILLTTYTTNCFAQNNTFNVVYTIDKNYPIFTLLSINSILENNLSNNKYHFYIIENNLTNNQKKMMKRFVNKRNQNIDFININNPIINNKKAYNSTYCTHITGIALARIYTSDLLPQDIDRVLYLDSDTLILSDLTPLFKTNIDNYMAGMVLNITENEDAVLYKFKNGYYNSGVILMNLKKAREEGSPKQFEKYYNDNIDKFLYNKTNEKIFPLPDQDLINVVWDGKINKLDGKWNQQQNLSTNTGILHYIGKNKPWYYNNPNNFNRLYWINWNKAPELRKYQFFYLSKRIITNYINYINRRLRQMLL